jgi:hypothetical protein
MDIVTKINNSMSQLNTTIAKKRQLNQSFKEELKGKLASIKETIAQIRTSFNVLKNKQNQMGIVDAQMRKLEEKNATLEAEVQKLNALAEKHGADKAELQKAHDALQQKIAQNDTALASKETEKQGLQASLEKIYEQLQEKINQLEDLTPGDADILQELEQIKKDLAELTGAPPPAPRAPGGPGGPGGPGFKSTVVPTKKTGVPVAKVPALGDRPAAGDGPRNPALVAKRVAAPENKSGITIPKTAPGANPVRIGSVSTPPKKGGFVARYTKRDTSSSRRKTKKHHKHHKRKHTRRHSKGRRVSSKGRRSSSTRRSSSSR